MLGIFAAFALLGFGCSAAISTVIPGAVDVARECNDPKPPWFRGRSGLCVKCGAGLEYRQEELACRPIPTPTPSATATPVPSATGSPSPTATPTESPTPNPTGTPAPTPTPAECTRVIEPARTEVLNPADAKRNEDGSYKWPTARHWLRDVERGCPPGSPPRCAVHLYNPNADGTALQMWWSAEGQRLRLNDPATGRVGGAWDEPISIERSYRQLGIAGVRTIPAVEEIVPCLPAVCVSPPVCVADEGPEGVYGCAVTEYSWTAVYNVFANRGGDFTD